METDTDGGVRVSENKKKVIDIDLKSGGETNELNIIDSPGGGIGNTFNIYIEKYNSMNQLIPGAEFRIEVLEDGESIGWLNETNSGYSYKNDYANAKKWTSESGKSISILDLRKRYTYRIYETKVATGYSYDSQRGNAKYRIGNSSSREGYNTIPSNNYIKIPSTDIKAIYIGEVSYHQQGTEAYVGVTNYNPGGGR